MDLLKALRSSINIVAVKLLVDVGFDPVIDLAQRMGIQSELLPTYSLALGASEVNLLELTSAYGTFAYKGVHVPVHGIRRVINSEGEVIYESSKEQTQALDADTAAIMTWMLRGVVEGGTGSNAYLGRPVAGKTGTSEKNRDLWFVGYIPQLATGVWLGKDDSTPTGGASSTAAAVWRMFMSQITDDIPVEQFPERPRLNGREATIEAKPVKPGKVFAAKAGASTEAASNRSSQPDRSDTASTETSSRSEQDASNSGASASSQPEAAPAPSAPAPIINEPPPQLDSKPDPAPVVAPATTEPQPVAPPPQPVQEVAAPAPPPAPIPPPIQSPPPPLQSAPPASNSEAGED